MGIDKKSISLTNRLRATSFVPALVVSLIMGITLYSVMEYNNNEALNSNALKTVKIMRVLFQGPLISGDKSVADTLMQSMMSDPDLISAKVFDASGALLAEGKNDNSPKFKTLGVSEIVYRDTLPVAIWDDEDQSSAVALGHIELVLAPEGANKRQRRVLLIWYSTTFFALVFSVFLGSIIGKSIQNPLRVISDTVREIRSGNYLTSKSVATNDELGLLSDSILHLAKELNAKDEAIDDQMAELLNSREEAIRLQEENAELLKDLSNEYSDPLIVAIGDLQRAAGQVNNGVPAELINSALRNIEYLLEITGDFGYLVDQTSRSEILRSVPVHINKLTNSVLSSFADQCTTRDISMTHEADGDHCMVDQTLYSDPIRIRVMMKNILEYAVLHSIPGASIAVRTMTRSQSNRGVIIIDIFDDNRYFSDEVLSVFSNYFNDSQDFLEHDEYSSIPIEYRTANRVIRSLNGNLSIKRWLNGGQILSIQFLTLMGPGKMPSADLADNTKPRTDILFYREVIEGNSIVNKYLKAKDIRILEVSSILSSPEKLSSPDCRLVFVELDLAHPEYSALLQCLQFPLQSKHITVIALIRSVDLNSIPNLMSSGFTEVIVMPVTASHICSIIDANSTITNSMKRIFTS